MSLQATWTYLCNRDIYQLTDLILGARLIPYSKMMPSYRTRITNTVKCIITLTTRFRARAANATINAAVAGIAGIPR